MSALICGSLAYDNIMVFQGRFRDHILPDKIHMLNVAFLVPQMRREFGGCAGNIAYNLTQLGGEGAPVGAVGHDFGPYDAWMARCGVKTDYLQRVDAAFTAQAYITTDMDDNQITAFHPGAMSHSHELAIPSDSGATLGIVSPDGREGMLKRATEFAGANIPFIFDPGQGLPMFDGAELLDFIEKATWVAVNDYEGEMLRERTGLDLVQIAERVDALVVTRGGKGSAIYTRGNVIEIPAAPVNLLSDPTGCGDAYRAGLIYGLMKGADWETTGRMASLMGAIKIESAGTQNHKLDRQSFAKRYFDAFSRELDV
jgi:adenosine kinase